MNAWIPNGIPMIVMHSRIPAAMLSRKSSHPTKKSHSRLKTMSRTVSASLLATTVRPKGHRTNPASLNAWIPNGMPMIVMHIRSPAIV